MLRLVETHKSAQKYKLLEYVSSFINTKNALKHDKSSIQFQKNVRQKIEIYKIQSIKNNKPFGLLKQTLIFPPSKINVKKVNETMSFNDS